MITGLETKIREARLVPSRQEKDLLCINRTSNNFRDKLSGCFYGFPIYSELPFERPYTHDLSSNIGKTVYKLG